MPKMVVSVRMEALPDKVDALIALATYNAEQTRQEPGNLRFDFFRSQDSPLKFGLYEVYKDEAAFQAHQQTPHYARWKAEISGLLAAPRVSEKHFLLSP